MKLTDIINKTFNKFSNRLSFLSVLLIAIVSILLFNYETNRRDQIIQNTYVNYTNQNFYSLVEKVTIFGDLISKTTRVYKRKESVKILLNKQVSNMAYEFLDKKNNNYLSAIAIKIDGVTKVYGANNVYVKRKEKEKIYRKFLDKPVGTYLYEDNEGLQNIILKENYRTFLGEKGLSRHSFSVVYFFESKIISDYFYRWVTTVNHTALLESASVDYKGHSIASFNNSIIDKDSSTIKIFDLINIKFSYKQSSFGFSLYLFGIVVFIGLVVVVLNYYMQKFSQKGLNRSLKYLSDMAIDIKGLNNQINKPLKIDGPVEIKAVREAVESLRQSMIKIAQEEQAYKTSRQIAHDIRSPLEALKSISNNIAILDYHSKLVINKSITRISDIANKLLKAKNQDSEESSCNIINVINDITVDKSYESNIDIEVNLNMAILDSFVAIDENDIYRALSNLINNSIEAKSTKISIGVTRVENSKIKITVRDNGDGIKAGMLENILREGVTTKAQGNGLGLSYCKSLIKSNNGVFNVFNQGDKGVQIDLIIPLQKSPGCFPEKVIIPSDVQKLIAIDDDDSFLELYQEKFSSFVRVEKYNSFQEVGLSGLPSIYFVDNDLNCEIQGVDYIIQSNIEENSYLVTSMFNDHKLRDKCIKNNIRMIPKQLFSSIEVTNMKKETKIIVLIDDDDLMHMTWKLSAEEKGIICHTFYSVNEFLSNSSNINNETEIYVDSSLGNNLKGEVEAEKIFNAGFQNISLATGYCVDELEIPNYIKSIQGKEFPTCL